MAVGRAAAAWLRHGSDAAEVAPVRVHVADPLCWAVPNMVEPGRGSDAPFLVRTRAFLDHPRLQVTQGDRVLASVRLRRMVPNRSRALSSGWLHAVRPGEDVVVSAS